MKKLYAPWREKYSTDTTHAKYDSTKEVDCVFCNKFKDPDDNKNYILKRYTHHAILLNLYPYNAGHLLIIPFKHVADLSKLSKAARTELMELMTSSTEIMKSVLDAHGVNIGVNLGKAAGAGIPSHLHIHVLPRYTGDTNFLPTLADTKQISFDLKAMYKTLKKSF